MSLARLEEMAKAIAGGYVAALATVNKPDVFAKLQPEVVANGIVELAECVIERIDSGPQQ